MRKEKFFAHVTYCEDVRFEIGGAQTLIGVMRGTLSVPAFPIMLTKFALVLDVCVDVKLEVMPVEFRVVLQNLAGIETEITRETMPWPDLETADSDEGRYRMVLGVMNYQPLALSEACGLFVHFKRDGEECVPPGLRFALLENAPSPPMAK